MLLRVEERQVSPGMTHVELSGKLTLGKESERIERLVEDLVETRRLLVILDMTGIDYIDSAGVGLVALAAGRLKEAGGRLVVVAPAGRVQHELQVTQMDRLVTVKATPAEAIAAFEAPPRDPAGS